jgi:hypothetical protein
VDLRDPQVVQVQVEHPDLLVLAVFQVQME